MTEGFLSELDKCGSRSKSQTN